MRLTRSPALTRAGSRQLRRKTGAPVPTTRRHCRPASRSAHAQPATPTAPTLTASADGRGNPGRWHRATIALGGVAVAVLVVAWSAPAAYAVTAQVPALAGSIEEVLANIRNWVMGILAALATVFLSIGGVRYLIAGGDPGEIEKAKAAFRAAAIGYGLAALAPVIVNVLKGIVGA